MDSTVPRSTKPVVITVASEQEPIVCDGMFSQLSDGFGLEFSIGEDRFTIEHTQTSTHIVAIGVMKYDITLGSERTFTVLDTPFGKVRFAVDTVVRDVSVTDGGVVIAVGYIMSSDAAGKIERTINLSARFTVAENAEQSRQGE